MEIKTKATEILKNHLGKTELSYLGVNEPMWDDLVNAVNEALNIPVVSQQRVLLKPIPPRECSQCGVLIHHRLNECGDCRL